MADRRLSACTAITALADGDLLLAVDISDNTDGANGTNKKITKEHLKADLQDVDSVNSKTGTVVLDADDIEDSTTTHKFVTAGDLTNLGNLSGTNTGDQSAGDFNHDDLASITGSVGEYNHPTDAQMTVLGNTSGTNTGDQSAGDFNHDDLASITGSVGEYNHPTDAQMTILGDTSGTNTGDQDLSDLALKSNVLELDNTDAFTPDADYEPATKKYVDENAGGGSMGDLDDVDLTGSEEGKILKVDSAGDFVIADDEDTIYTHPNHSGDVTSVADGATTIANSAVTNAKMANMATKTYKGRTSAGTGVPEDVAVATLKTDLSLTKADVGLSNVANVDTTNASNISTGTLSSSVLPPVAITTVSVVASEIEQLALTAQEGDVAVRTDEDKTYMRNSGSAEDMTDWTELQTPTDSVLSVNGKTGTVTLNQDDIGDGSTYVRTTNDYNDTAVSKLSGIEAGADVTDTSNVTDAGALMDTEVDADLKTFSLPADTTISAFGKTLVDDADASAARTTLGGVALASNVLELDNTDEFTPDADYEPATKKYVDENAGGADVLVSVYHDAHQSISNNSPTDLAFNTERFDTDGIHDTTTNNSRFTCKTAGVYQITGSILFSANATGDRSVAIKLNNDKYIAGNLARAAGTIKTSMSVSVLWELEVDDYIELEVYQTSGGSLNLEYDALRSPNFQMVKVGEPTS